MIHLPFVLTRDSCRGWPYISFGEYITLFRTFRTCASRPGTERMARMGVYSSWLSSWIGGLGVRCAYVIRSCGRGEHREFPFARLPLSPNFLPSFMGPILVCMSGTRPIKLSFNARISISFHFVLFLCHSILLLLVNHILTFANRPQNTNSPHPGPETLSYPLHRAPNISRIPISRTPNGKSVQPTTHLPLL